MCKNGGTDRGAVWGGSDGPREHRIKSILLVTEPLKGAWPYAMACSAYWIIRHCRYVTKPTRPTQPCVHLGSLNRLPALIYWVKGGSVSCARRQVTLGDTMWRVNSSRGEACLRTAIRVYRLPVKSFRISETQCTY